MTENELIFGNRAASEDDERYMEVDQLIHHCSPCFITRLCNPPRIEPDPIAVKLLNKTLKRSKEVSSVR